MFIRPLDRRPSELSANLSLAVSFDLWEEINSSSFFTTAAQHRALHEGAALARTLGQNDLATTYETQAGNVLCFQQVR